VFDGEELLLRSIESIRPVVQFVAVVYQTTSNFGDAAAPELMPTLQARPSSTPSRTVAQNVTLDLCAGAFRARSD
jgi:hypothetical protein